MALSDNLIRQFVKSTKDNKEAKVQSQLYGTVVYDGQTYVKLDGSELLTPASSTVTVKDGDRVTVNIQNHSAMITGNTTDPSASGTNVEKLGSKVTQIDNLMAYKITTDELNATAAIIEDLKVKLADIGKLEAVEAEINELEAKYANLENITADDVEALNADIQHLEAQFASFDDVEADRLEAIYADIDQLRGYNAEFTYVSADNLKAISAKIDNLDVGGLTAEEADIRYAKINDLEALEGDFEKLKADTITGENLGAINAKIEDLETTIFDAESGDIKFANIDFSNIGEAAVKKIFTDSGIIKDLVVDEGHITGELVGVTIKGDLIEGGTVVADKLVVQGNDGLYYKLNTDGVKIEANQTDYNSLNGRVITAKSITASKISVSDLVAFDATIGGFNITENSIYSGVKQSPDNTTRGIYLDNEGQVAFGDAHNYLKYFKDENGTYKLAISAGSIYLGASNTSVEDTIDELKNVQIGATNLIRNSETLIFQDYSFGEAESILFLTDESDVIFVDESDNLFIE